MADNEQNADKGPSDPNVNQFEPEPNDVTIAPTEDEITTADSEGEIIAAQGGDEEEYTMGDADNPEESVTAFLTTVDTESEAGDVELSADLERELAEAQKIADESEFEFKGQVGAEVIEEEDSDEGGIKKIYAGEYMKAFSPLRYLIFWTYPFNIVKSSDNSYLIHASLSSCGGIGFVLSTVFAIILFIATWIGMFSFFLEVPLQTSHGTSHRKNTSKWNGRAEEIFLLHRNFPIFVVFLTSMFHIVVGNWSFYKKRVEIAEYLTFWTEALQIMKIHSAKEVFTQMLWLSVLFVLFLLTIILMGVFHLAPVASGGPGFVAHVVLRPIIPEFFAWKEYKSVTMAFGFIFVYVFFASKIYVFLYMFKCLIMKHTFEKWSSRLDEVVNRDDNLIVRNDRLGKRTGFKELYQDHVVLLDLIDGADMMFGESIESYFTATEGNLDHTFSLCFECFYLWRVLTNKEDFPPARFADIYFIGLFLFQTILIVLLSSSLSADVADAAMEGLEVLRRKGFFGRKSGEELYFLMSLYSSYSGAEDTAISGAGYFVLDQSFLVTVIGTFLSYVIILFQFNPPMEFKDDRLVPLVLDKPRLLDQVEEKMGNFFGDSDSKSAEAMMMHEITWYLNRNASVPEGENLQKLLGFSFTGP